MSWFEIIVIVGSGLFTIQVIAILFKLYIFLDEGIKYFRGWHGNRKLRRYPNETH